MGLDSLKESSAFKKIKTNSKAPYANFISNFETTPLRLNSTSGKFSGDSDFTTAGVYGLQRQHSYLNLKAQGGSLPPFIDSKSFKKFLSLSNNPSLAPNQNTNPTPVNSFQRLNP